MATGNNIKNFTAADIERYHKGLLSATERHDLEKAALDDPFLADALEGYAVAGQEAETHLRDLRNRLSKKVEGAKVVPLAERKKKAIPWLRVAALVIIIAGAALLANQFLLNNKNKGSIAKNEIKKTESPGLRDSLAPVTVTTETKNQVITTGKDRGEKETAKLTTHTPGETKQTKPATTLTGTEDLATETQPVTRTTNPAVNAGADEKTRKAEKDLAKEKVKDVTAPEDKYKVKEQADTDIASEKKRNDVTVPRRANEEPGTGYNQSNTFRGRVTDANNVGVPFANVTNAQDNNAGTYTDARGNFTLTYPDTVLDVQVRSIGFENRSVQLRNTVPDNQVVLKDDKSLSEVVVSNQKPNAAARNRDVSMNMKLEEPEPADGWENYDAYLANNLNAPEEIRTKQTVGGHVQVSFEVNKEGEPVNIRVEKSLCNKCDKEAIRLIKDGPKWKRNANKKGRTTVTINF